MSSNSTEGTPPAPSQNQQKVAQQQHLFTSAGGSETQNNDNQHTSSNNPEDHSSLIQGKNISNVAQVTQQPTITSDGSQTPVFNDEKDNTPFSNDVLNPTDLQDDTTTTTTSDFGKGEEDDTDKKFVKCPHCPQTFSRIHNLKSHLTIHSQAKPFLCSICTMKFRRLHDLKRHEKLHTGEKPYECQTCGRKFARADALVRHTNSQTGCTLLMDSNNGSVTSDTNSRRSSISSISASTTGGGSRKIVKYETNQWRIDSLPSIKTPESTTRQIDYSNKSNSFSNAPTTAETSNPLSNSNLSFQQQNESNTTIQKSALRDLNPEVMKYIQSLEQRVWSLENKVNQLTHLQSLQYQAQSLQQNLQNNLHHNLQQSLSSVNFNIPNLNGSSDSFVSGLQPSITPKAPGQNVQR